MVGRDIAGCRAPSRRTAAAVRHRSLGLAAEAPQAHVAVCSQRRRVLSKLQDAHNGTLIQDDVVHCHGKRGVEADANVRAPVLHLDADGILLHFKPLFCEVLPRCQRSVSKFVLKSSHGKVEPENLL
eukprot:2992785-Prymnesium_polylepis.1